MCLLAFQLDQHPAYKFIMIANRDEFYGRPTAEAQFWQDQPSILAGRDLQQMGTWLGVNKQGRIAALTNYRDFSLPLTGPKSRGEIAVSFLQSTEPAPRFMERLHERREDYAGFNFLAGTPEELYYYSNIQQQILHVPKGTTHGLSNHLLNTPWPKVETAKQLLEDYTNSHPVIEPDRLFEFMQRSEQFPDSQLPDTGVGLELERTLSSLFIRSEDYGTRCTTVLLIDRSGHIYFEERTYKNGKYQSSSVYSFDSQKAIDF